MLRYPTEREESREVDTRPCIAGPFAYGGGLAFKLERGEGYATPLHEVDSAG